MSRIPFVSNTLEIQSNGVEHILLDSTAWPNALFDGVIRCDKMKSEHALQTIIYLQYFDELDVYFDYTHLGSYWNHRRYSNRQIYISPIPQTKHFKLSLKQLYGPPISYDYVIYKTE